ncbi:MAG: hypothetical protein K2H29_04760 [Oscillospiraceae bacterium]|nr:hypothetical protein [Oscillospiraceae bacterium]
MGAKKNTFSKINAFIILIFLIMMFVMNQKYVCLNKKLYPVDIRELSIDCSIDRNPDLEKLQYFKSLECFSLSFLPESISYEVKYIETLNRLEKLRFSYCSVEDLTFIKSLNQLCSFHIFQSDVDFSDLENDSLKEISIWESHVIEFKAIEKISTLESIDIINIDGVTTNKLYETLKKLPNLKKMRLTSSSFAEDLSELEKLEELEIAGQFDYLTILSIPSLKKITISENILSNQEIEKLKECGVSVTFFN